MRARVRLRVLDTTPAKVYPVSFCNPLHLTTICCCDTANKGSSSKQTGSQVSCSCYHLCHFFAFNCHESNLIKGESYSVA